MATTEENEVTFDSSALVLSAAVLFPLAVVIVSCVNCTCRVKRRYQVKKKVDEEMPLNSGIQERDAPTQQVTDVPCDNGPSNEVKESIVQINEQTSNLAMDNAQPKVEVNQPTSGVAETNQQSKESATSVGQLQDSSQTINSVKTSQRESTGIPEPKERIPTAKSKNDDKHVLGAKLESTSEESPVQIDFKPTFVKTFRTQVAKKDGKAIFGLAVVDQELFIISQNSPDIEVYDAKTLEFTNQWHIEDLFDPVDITSCARNKCLYIFDWIGESPNEILRIQPDGKLLNKWTTGEDGGYLSVTRDSNVILSVWDKNKLSEYTPEGQLVREIQLSSTISELRHAIQLTSGQFVVSHGEDRDSQHRVCLVNEKGNVIKVFGGEIGSGNDKVDCPNYLTIDGAGFVLVADQNNKRVILLSPDLEFLKELVQEGEGLRYPVRMHLDGATGRLFVTDNDCLSGVKWRDGRVYVYDFISQTNK